MLTYATRSCQLSLDALTGSLPAQDCFRSGSADDILGKHVRLQDAAQTSRVVFLPLGLNDILRRRGDTLGTANGRSRSACQSYQNHIWGTSNVKGNSLDAAVKQTN